MRPTARLALAALPVAVAADAARFRRRQAQRLRDRADGLRRLKAYVDDNPPGGSCNLKGCTSNSIDADCKKIACKAGELGCSGNYGSGGCKDLKELHDAGMCELAKSGCGDTLPKDPAPECRHWWSYACRFGVPRLPVGIARD